MKRYLCFILSFLCAISTCVAAVYYVVPGGAGSKNGTSWANALDSIEAAVEKVSSNDDEIWVAEGEYTISREIYPTVKINMYGGFRGTETSVNGRDLSRRSTVMGTLSDEAVAQLSAYPYRYNSSSSIFSSSFGCMSGKIDGFLFTKFTNVFGSSTNIYSLDVSNCDFRYCLNVGGGISCLYNSTFKYCGRGSSSASTTSSPAVISSPREVKNCSFSMLGSAAVSVGSSMGTSSYEQTSYVIENSSFTNCTQGALNIYASATIRNCLIANNESGYGGGIYVASYAAEVYIINSTIVNNNATLTAYVTSGSYDTSNPAGGAIAFEKYNSMYTSGRPKYYIVNSILWGNKCDNEESAMVGFFTRSMYESSNLIPDVYFLGCVLQSGVSEFTNTGCSFASPKLTAPMNISSSSPLEQCVPMSGSSAYGTGLSASALNGYGMTAALPSADIAGKSRSGTMTAGASVYKASSMSITSQLKASSAAIVKGATTTLSVSASNAAAYVWLCDRENSGKFSEVARTSTPSYAASKWGIYKVVVLDSNGGAVESQSVAITSPRIYVKTNGNDAAAGTSWSSAKKTIQAAIDSCYMNDIWIAAGTYTPEEISHSEHFGFTSVSYMNSNAYRIYEIPSHISLYGGFAGTETNISQRDWKNNKTIFNGKIGYDSSNGTNPYLSTIVFFRNGSKNSKIDGIHFIGDVSEENSYYSCYSVYADCAECRIENCVFDKLVQGLQIYQSPSAVIYNCYYTNNAGGIFVGNSRFTMANCKFAYNSGSGTVGIENSSASLSNCLFYKDSSYCAFYIYAYSAAANHNISCTNCAFIGCKKAMSAYASAQTGAPAYVSNSIFLGNLDDYNNSENGQISGNVRLDYCSISESYRQYIQANNVGVVIGDGNIYSNITLDESNILSQENAPFDASSPLYKSGATEATLASLGIPANVPQQDINGFARSGTPSIGAWDTAKISIATADGKRRYNPAEKFTLIANVEGLDGTLTYNWYKDGALLAVTTTPSYKTSQQIGNASYSVRVDNGVNSISAVAPVTIISSLTEKDIFYVVPNGAGSKNGSSWANAYADVQTAIDAAAALAAENSFTVEVWIKAGTYKHGSAMTMKNNVAIYGGFAGTETNLNQRVPGQNRTYLDGENSYRVFYNNYTEANPLTNSAKLDNVTVRNGEFVTNNGNYPDGVGMYNNYASPEITNCIFTANVTSAGGGGMYNNYSNPILTNCTFSNNTAHSGGGMYNHYSNPILTDCTFSNNTVSNSGGGIFNYEKNSPTLINCTFSNNTAHSGGGMYNTTYSYNTNDDCLTLTNCTFRNNIASSEGGGISVLGGSSTLTNCTFIENSVSYYGGGMAIRGTITGYTSVPATSTLVNCTFIGNNASAGGGISNSCSPTLINCTFSGNIAAPSDSSSSYSSSGGAGMHNSGSPIITNCIFWDDLSNTGNEIYNESSYATPALDTCIIRGGMGGIYNNQYGTYANVVSANPKLGTLGDYSGYVQTIPVLSGSPAIGAGKVVEGVTTDARGIARSTTAPTIGAYEFANKLIAVSITSPEGYTQYSSDYEFTLSAIVSDVASSLTYQWYKNGAAISGATSSSYKTKQAAGSAVYTVKVSDGTTTITSSPLTIKTVATPRYYVSTTGSSANDGLSWATAKSDVQEAIDLAAELNIRGVEAEVWIAAGTYKHGSEMTMKNNVAIYGGFAGTETSKEQRIAGQNQTYLDGENSYRVFYNNFTSDAPLTISAKLDNVTIQNGYQSGSNNGGGMYNYNASPEITNSTFRNNTTNLYGGGIYNDTGSALTLKNCVIANNQAYYGGGIYNNRDASSALINCTLAGNTASYGGGMYAYGNSTLINCTFSNNTASSSGGGMFNYDNGDPILMHCTFVGNAAGLDGGGMYNYYSNPAITNCIFWNDTAPTAKEILNTINITPTFDTCIIEGGAESIGNNTCGTYTNIITADPKLANLGDYGGNAPTMPVCAGSSAIGAGKVVAGVTTDARGVARSTTAPTIGACEFANKLSHAAIITTEGYTKYSSTSEFTLNANVPDVASALTYQWYKNGAAISGATSSSYKTKQPVGSAVYTVKVSNADATITSAPLTIETVATPRYYVSTTGSSANNGLSWATAKSDVQEAIDLAASVCGGGEVWIKAGTYKHGSAMTMKNNVAIYGGFAGTETNKNQRIAGQNKTCLDGNKSYRVFDNTYTENNPLTSSAKLDNVTIQNGDATYNNGGGMNNQFASPEITNCVFSANTASNGGALYILGGNPTIINCAFIENTAFYGGALCSSGDSTLLNCIFSGNAATYSGGSMYNISNSSPTLTNCTFTNNTASSGGSIYNNNGSPTITNCVFWGDTANTGNEIYNEYYSASTPKLDTCVVQGGYSGSGTYTNIIIDDPKLGELGDYGGYVPTIPVLSGSSAIGAGKVVEGVTTDARGVARSTTAPTIGAYESEIISPTITTQPVALAIFANGGGSLTVAASGEALSYQWYKNGSAISGATFATLNLTNVQASNAGSYYCVVSNPAGSVQTNTVSLTVKPKPTITTQPVALSLFANGSGSLTVAASGEALTYQWYKDGSAVSGATSATLSFENIQTSNAGSYYCVVSNPAGSVQTNTVSVAVKQAYSVYYVTPNGAGSKNGSSWANAYGNIQLAINEAASVAAELSRTIEVWVAAGTYNVASAITLKSKVAIYGGFTGTETSKDQRTVGNETIIAPDNSDIRLFVISNTDSSASLNNLTLKNPNSTQPAIGGTAANVSIQNCRFVDCITTTTVNSGAAINVISGSNLTVSNCEFINCSTQWSAGAIYVRESVLKVENCYFEGCNARYASVLHSNNSNVEIVNCTLNNNYSTASGSHEAIHCANGSQMKVVYCTIIQSPDCSGCAFEVNASSCEVYNSILLNNNYGKVAHVYGDNAEFTTHNCLVDKKYSDGDIVTADARLSEAAYNGGFVKTMAANDDSPALFAAQAYEGVETDARGVARYAASPTIGAYEYVIQAPVITAQPTALAVYANNNGSLTVSASKHLLTYQWYKDGAAIAGATEATLNFTNAQASNAGSYYCIVNNPAGSAKSNTVNVTVKPEPTITTQPLAITIYSGVKAELTVAASGDSLTYQWYKNGSAISGATKATLSFANIQTSNAGSYYCVVSNPAGSVQTNTVSVTVKDNVYVTPNGAGIKDGSSWANAYDNIQFAINEAASAGAELSRTIEVWLAAGTYNRTSSITLKSKVAVYGGFAGTETSKDQRTAGNETIIVPDNSDTRLFVISSTDNSASLNNLTINTPNSTKSAILGSAANAAIRNCRFIDCMATNGYSGAAMSINGDGCPTVSNCEFINCSTQWSAGAIYVKDSAIKIENCYFEGCNSPRASVLHSNNSNVEIVNCTFNKNYSTEASSNEAIQCANGSQMKVVYCTIIQSPDCNGCAFEVSASSCLVYNSILLNNNYGKIVHDQNNGITFEVHNCIVDKKYSDGDIVTADAKLSEAAYNGGFVKTMAVMSASPAIRAAQPHEGVTTDARGVARSTTAPTIGAYEYVVYDCAKWASDRGLSGDDALPSAIPHSDGITNLEKFAFGLDASKAASYADNPHFAQSVEGGAMVLSFPISVDAEDAVTVKALMSTDLINWTETTATATGTSKDGKYKLYKATATISTSGKVFLKLKVEEK